MIGALIMSVLRNGSQQMGWPTYFQEIIIGLVIIVAVFLDRLRQSRAAQPCPCSSRPRRRRRIRRLLCGLQDHILAHLLRARAGGIRGFARVSAVTASDTIYRVDRLSEAAIDAWLEEHWPRSWPVEIVMEGREEGMTHPRGLVPERTRFKLIIDPIDGTRNLMYDKRSAWTLAGLAPQRGGRTHLGDIAVAAMTELPTSKQERSDQFSAVRGCGPAGVVAECADLRAGGRRRRFRPRPSAAHRLPRRLRLHRPFLSRGQDAPRRLRGGALAQALRTGRSGPLARIRGPIPFHRRPDLRTAFRPRPAHRRPAAAGLSQTRAGPRSHLPSLRHLHRADPAGGGRSGRGPGRAASPGPPRRRLTRGLGRLRQSRPGPPGPAGPAPAGPGVF